MTTCKPRSLKELVLLMLIHPNPLHLLITIAFIHFLPTLKEITKELLTLLLIGGLKHGGKGSARPHNQLSVS